ncbi:sigma-54 interaction domain-containing protein [Uliginosibacterium sediminicola]|uniref:Sigma 54-interacting transcriptional regulator n=1 Tax=Uliginosibacterium sediminicola TaxID=2024550 RepID=A0ABU9Z3A2_9RHOO
MIPNTHSPAEFADSGDSPAASAVQGHLLTLPSSKDQALSIRAKALVFHDPKSAAIYQHLEQIAPSDANVLILGEIGTGKELIARHIHTISGRSGPFLAVNCGAFNDNQLEAELFGHEAGTLASTTAARAGWFEAAQGGTLFLDEVGDLPLSTQIKLLRVLQERQVLRLGSGEAIPLDIRLVAGTNVDLERAVRAGHFRRELFYRLNVAPLHLPPLRERRGDILPLARYFIDYHRQKMQRSQPVLSPEAEQRLLRYEWPGNIRELENVVHFALIVCHNNIIGATDLRLPHLAAQAPSLAPVVAENRAPEIAASLDALREPLQRLLGSAAPKLYEQIEHLIFRTALAHHQHDQERTARGLGIHRAELDSQLKRYGLIEDKGRDPHS